MTTYKRDEWNRDGFGKFDKKRRGLTKWDIVIALGLVVIAATCGYIAIKHIVLGPVETYVAPVAKADTPQIPDTTGLTGDSLKAKVTEIKADLVESLAKCESLGHADDYGLIVYDNNSRGTLSDRNIPSIGALQFKVTTVQKYEKMRSGTTLSGKDAIELALDAQQSRDLATYVIFETDNGIANWTNCATQLGLPSEIKVIKKLLN